MSFINLYENYIWSDRDIDAKTESLIASEFTADDVAILNRKVSGAAMGAYELTPGEMGLIYKYTTVSNQARQEGNDARADRALLAEIMQIESNTNEVPASPLALEWVQLRASKTIQTMIKKEDYEAGILQGN